MLKQIRIQNYKSLKDVTLDLDHVNLFIGPNNSGKSNVLSALKYFAKIYSNKGVPESNSSSTFMRKGFSHDNPLSISFKFIYDNELYFYKFEILSDAKIASYNEFVGVTKNNDFPIQNLILSDFFKYDSIFSTYGINSTSTVLEDIIAKKVAGFGQSITSSDRSAFILRRKKNGTPILSNGVYAPGAIATDCFYEFGKYLEQFLSSIIIYKPDVVLIKKSVEKDEINALYEDGSNLSDFLFSFSQNHKKKFNEFLEDFKACVSEFKDISTPFNPENKHTKSLKIKFFDEYDNSYWIDEVSDGVIYFLVLLAIIHQPNPPRILLLEEPETGIHPRRTKEIADYIFKLAEEKNIQIILTSHSPLILEKFNSTPQAVFVFDKENGETKIKNLLKDIIEVNNKKLLEQGLAEINYTVSLGEHWLDGFIGGVPDEAN